MKTIDELLADIGAITGDKTKLATGAALPADLVSGGNTILTLTTERDSARASLATEQGRVNTLTGDKTKLSAGAVLPADLVSAANEIATLKASVTTVEQAVASKLVELGVSDNGKKEQAEGKGGEKLTTTQRVLKAKGLPIDTKVQIGFGNNGASEE